MTLNQTLSLGTAGAVATAIGLALAITPTAFLAGSGIALGPDPNLLSELRAPGAGLAGMGLAMLAALRRPSLLPTALILAAIVYVGFPAGRVAGIALDGMPSNEILAALAAEIVIALWLVRAFLPARRRVAA
jgi:hypothetical protein